MCPSQFFNHLDGRKRAGCFTLFVFLVSFYCYCSVALPQGAMDWSAVCDCSSSIFIFTCFSIYRLNEISNEINCIS